MKLGFDHKDSFLPFKDDMEKTIAEKKKKKPAVQNKNKNSAGKKK